MINKTVKSKKQTKLFINIFCLVFITSLAVFTPAVSRLQGQAHPSVKASYVSEPKTPISHGLLPPDLTATGVYIADFNTGIVLYDKNPHLRLKPASLTKIMTALVSLDHYPEDFVLSVVNGQKAIGATAKLIRGDELTFQNTLLALLIPSGNDAAVTLAENYPGGYKSFVDQMNSKVQELGLFNTHFENVSGVEGKNHYTSAYDMAMIAKSALERNLFSTTVSTQKTTITSLKGFRYPLETTNKLLGKQGVLGVKTGWTPEAGECLVTLVSRRDHPIIISLLGSKDRFGESEEIIDWIYANHTWE